MSGKHLCQSRLSATYISSNRYMHIILFYFRLFILFSPGLPFIRSSSVFLRSSSGPPSLFLRSSFVLPSSFIRLFHILHPALFQPSFIFLRPSPGLPSPFPLFSLCFLSVILFTLSSPFQLSSSSFPARPGIPCHPEPVLLVILSASEGSSPTDFSIIISKHTKI